MIYLEAKAWSTNGGRSKRQGQLRDGSLLIEAVVAILLLATASLAVMKLSATSVALQRDAEQELAATLTAQNILARLDRLSPDTFDDLEGLSKSLDQIKDSYEETFPGDVAITARRFDNQGIAGTHLHVLVTIGPNVRVALDDWRLETASQNEPNASTQDDVTRTSARRPASLYARSDTNLVIAVTQPVFERGTKS